ncbi:MAG: 2-phospho-L-lactate transferase CofD family protein [Patescibacteria group bacterium]
MVQKTVKVAVSAGGSGAPILVEALLLAADKLGIGIFVDVICSPCDYGGGTKDIRRRFGIGPFADPAKNALALSEHPDRDAIRRWLTSRADLDIFPEQQRRSGERHRGQSHLNVHFTGATMMTGSHEAALREFERQLRVRRGRVHLASWDPDIHVDALLKNGQLIWGEAAIDHRSSHRGVPIEKIQLRPEAPLPSPAVIEAIKDADLVIWSFGDIWSSLGPIWLVPGLTRAARVNCGQLLVFANLMTKTDETDGWGAAQLVTMAEQFVDRKADIVVMDTKLGDLDPQVLSRYAAEGAAPVAVDIPVGQWEDRTVFGGDWHNLDEAGALRHDLHKIAGLLQTILGNLQ